MKALGKCCTPLILTKYVMFVVLTILIIMIIIVIHSRHTLQVLYGNMKQRIDVAFFLYYVCLIFSSLLKV